MSPIEEETIPAAADHGALPPWRKADLPDPLPFSLRNAFRTIGPGAILLAGAIGGGEWIVGPLMTVTYGASILWIATAAIALQMVFNLEAVRYTLYTGEPIYTGFMRLRPGATFWSIFYIIMGVAQLATPALAAGCATVLFAGLAGRLPVASDETLRLVLASGIIIAAAALLLSGRSIERRLERLSWVMIAFIFLFLVVVNVLCVPAEGWLRTAQGFVTPHRLPDNMDLALLALFAGTAGSGGLGNLCISSWFRDKGFGMGAHMGAIGGALAHGHKELASVGCTFEPNAKNLGRWRTWWKYALLDQTGLWALGCLVGMFLNINLAAAIIPANTQLAENQAGAYQAEYLATNLWAGFWTLALLNGFWILFSTHLGNTDCLVRTVTDICWTGHPRTRRWPASRVYAAILLVLTAWALVSIHFGTVVALFKILGVMTSPIMAVAALQILRVNTRFLPPEIRPPLWRKAALVACAIVYGGITAALLLDLAQGLFGAS